MGNSFNRENTGCPCKDCTERKPGTGCHDRCAKYGAWREKHDKKKKAEREYNEAIHNMSDAKRRETWRKQRYSRQGGKLSSKIQNN